MLGLKHKTRGKSSPQGKSRVYFTCHPEDFKGYFESITEDILKRQNCAIFFLEPDGVIGDNAEYEMDLSQMQLFVVPVTTRLLTTPNRAMDLDVPYAFEHHIPVLPLMQESGLDELFAEKFGDLQYLDKNNTDATAISFDEKLEKYLNSVIVGDELAAKVRGAFDAYVFLSYRKKDRKYAQQLMKLIHSVPFCRDIAIWYDEFLTPGENFNDAIREALEKSQLFALAVTPNLVNEINYILTTEYPMAQRLGKDILPAELLPTDREKLSEMYEDIPQVVDRDDEKALTARLLDAVRRMAIRSNDSDPQHNFFIGLAYLSGIDVEIDHRRAEELITCSADSGFMEAIRKLISMYDYGEGVERDRSKAAMWCGRLVEALRSGEDKRELYWALADWGEHLDSEKDEQKNVYLEMLEVGGSLGAFEVSHAYKKLGDNAGKADRENAREYYKKCVEAIDRIPESQCAEDPGVMWHTVRNLRSIADYEDLYGDAEAADAYFNKSIAYSERFISLFKNDFEASNFIESVIEYAHDKESSEKDREAIGWYTKALSYVEKYKREYSGPNLKRIEYKCLIGLGRIHYRRKAYADAAPYYRRAYDMIDGEKRLGAIEGLSRVEEALGNTKEAERVYRSIFDKYREDGAAEDQIPYDCYARIADLEALNAKPEAASAHYERALLTQDLTVDAYFGEDELWSLCELYYRAGHVEMQLERPDRAAVYYKKALDLCRNSDPIYKAAWVALLSHGCLFLAEAEKALGNDREAAGYYNETFELRTTPIQVAENLYYDIYEGELKLYDEDPCRCCQTIIPLDERLAEAVDTYDGWEFLADRYERAVSMLDDADGEDDACRSFMLSCCQKAIALIEKRLCDKEPEKYYRKIAGYYYQLGIYAAPKRKKEMYGHAAECYEKLQRLFADSGNEEQAVKLYEDIARCRESAGDLEAAAQLRKQALEAVQKGDPEHYTAEEKAVLLEKLTTSYRSEEDLGNLEEAARLAEEAVRLTEDLYEETKDRFLYNRRPDRYFDAGQIERKRKNNDKAAEYYEKGIFYSEIILRYYSSNDWYGTYLAYRELGEIEAERGNTASAIEYYQKIPALEEISKKPVRIGSEIKYEVLNRIGDLHTTAGSLKDAAAYYRQAVDVLKAVARDSGKQYDVRNVYDRLSELGKAEEEAKRYQEALEYDIEAKEYCEQNMTHDRRRRLQCLSQLYYHMARCYKGAEFFDAASDCHSAYVSLTEELYTDTEDPDDTLDLIYASSGVMEKQMGHFGKAAEYFLKLAGYREKLLKKDNSVKRRDWLSSAYVYLADAERRNENRTQARLYYKKALDIAVNIAEEERTDKRQFQLAEKYYLYAVADEDDILSEMIRKASDILDPLIRKDPENTEYSGIREKLRRIEELLIEYRGLSDELEQLTGFFRKKKREQCKQKLDQSKSELLQIINDGVFR